MGLPASVDLLDWNRNKGADPALKDLDKGTKRLLGEVTCAVGCGQIKPRLSAA
jgi:hypothetical protein